MENSLLRKVQMEQLEIAKELKRVCDQLEIDYFLDSGTLLGAVRHQGFIPWDDDMDIGMMRDEYERFLELAPAVLDDKYFLQTCKSDPAYGHVFAKLRKNGTEYIEEGAKDSSAHCGFYIDIFPYDVFPEDKRKQKWQGKRYYFLRRCLLVKCGYTPWVMNAYGIKKHIKKLLYFPIKVYAKLKSKDRLIDNYHKMCTKFNSENSDYVYEQAGAAAYGKWVIPKACFREYPLMDFENEKFKVPGEYDLYLKSVYGDYMELPPKDKRVNRHKIVRVKFHDER